MNTFDSSKHPRGGHFDNPGKFSVAELDEVALADLDDLSSTKTSALRSAVESAIERGDLAGKTWIEGDKVAYRDSRGVTYLVASDSNSVWAYPADGLEFEAEYFSANVGKFNDVTVKALKAARSADVSRTAWAASANAYSDISLQRGAPTVQRAVVVDGALVVNPGSVTHRTRFSSFEAHDEIHDGHASMSVELADSVADLSYVVTCDPDTLDVSVFRGYDITEVPHWESQAVFDQIHTRTGLDRVCITDLLAGPAREVDAASEPTVALG